jgi:hypothetical protein
MEFQAMATETDITSNFAGNLPIKQNRAVV